MENVSISACVDIVKAVEPTIFKDITVHSEHWKYYRFMILFLYGTLNSVHEAKELHKLTKFSFKHCYDVCENLKKNYVWENGVTYADIFDEKIGYMEVILCTLCATGELRRMKVEDEKEFVSFALIPENVFASRNNPEEENLLIKKLKSLLYLKKSPDYYAKKLNIPVQQLTYLRTKLKSLKHEKID